MLVKFKFKYFLLPNLKILIQFLVKSHHADRSSLSHIDHENEISFGEKDLEKLMVQLNKLNIDFDEYDKLRKEEFKKYEMQKEIDRKKKLLEMDEASRKIAEEEHKKNLENKRNHDKVNAPGSHAQLEEVWKKQDNLEPETFDPLTFFKLHGIF